MTIFGQKFPWHVYDRSWSGESGYLNNLASEHRVLAKIAFFVFGHEFKKPNIRILKI